MAITPVGNYSYMVNVMVYDPIAKKLNEQMVHDIRRLIQGKTMTLRAIAELYNVSEVTIGNIKRRKIWADV